MKSKKVISIILSVSISIGSILCTNFITKAANLTHGTVTVKEGLNVRISANTSAKIITTLKEGTSIDILETYGDWYKIKIDNSYGYGYVYKQYIKLTDTTSSQNNSNSPSTNTTNITNTTTSSSINNTTTSSSINSGNTPTYKNFDEKKDISKFKQWEIKFNRNIKNDDSINSEIKVTDSKGNFIPTKLLVDKNIITVIPWDTGYNYEENYKLIIGTNIQSSDGLKLKYTSVLPFTIKSELESWNLGKTQTEYVHNDRSYDWYIDEGDTGKYANVNSGPSCAVMAAKWANSSLSQTAEDARNKYEESGSLWSNDDIITYLKDYDINYSTMDTISEDSLKKQLKNGNILILNLNPKYIDYSNDYESKLGRFHLDESNSYNVIVKGYKIVDGKTYFEVYDPLSNHTNYWDGTPKGKNIYYTSDNILNSLKNNNISPIIVNDKVSQ